MQSEKIGWNVRRIVLTVLSVIIGLFISSALLASWNEPQVAGKLNLYQTNIMLQGSTLAADPNIPPALYDALIGKEAVNLAKTQYQEARTTARDTADELQKRLPPATISPAQRTPESDAFQKANHDLQEINLDLGLIQAVQKQPIAAQQLWQQIERDIPGSAIATTAEILNQLWTAEKPVPAKAENIITKNLQGWFKYQSLKQLYTKQTATAKLQTLESQQISTATGSVYRLATMGIIRGGCVILGIGLGLWWGISKLWQKRGDPPRTEGLVMLRTNVMGEVITNEPRLPSAPWNWETIWQVMLGFFVIGQLLIPQFFSIAIKASGWDRQHASLLENAAFILVSYGVLAIAMIAFLRLSIASYQPIDAEWFSFRGENWVQWGIGGYLVATPIVLLVSVINDKIWQGKGGSNPLLSLLLENNDGWAFFIFMIT